MIRYRSSKLWLWAALAALLLSACQPVKPQRAQQVPLQLVSHVAAGMAEQDVYVARVENAGEVFRLTGEKVGSYLDAPVYAAQEAIEHDLFDLGDNPLGPYPQGVPLGFTLGEWLAAGATGSYTVQGEQATLDLTFTRLVPLSVYMVWCATVNTPPNVSIVDKPCGAADGSENVFVADSNGNATFRLTMPPLVETTDTSLQVIAAAYHSDGKSYGALPGDFGLNSHVQIAAVIPPPDSEAWQTVTDGAVAVR
jgi:hypothetical protein